MFDKGSGLPYTGVGFGGVTGADITKIKEFPAPEENIPESSITQVTLIPFNFWPIL